MRVLLQKVAATATTATAFPVIWRGCEQHCATRQESGGKRINDFGSLSSRSLGAQRIGRKRNKDFYTTLCINGHTHHHHRLIPSTMLPMMEETDPFARRWAATSVSCQLDPPDLATSIWIAILLCAGEKRDLLLLLLLLPRVKFISMWTRYDPKINNMGCGFASMGVGAGAVSLYPSNISLFGLNYILKSIVYIFWYSCRYCCWTAGFCIFIMHIIRIEKIWDLFPYSCPPPLSVPRETRNPVNVYDKAYYRWRLSARI